MGSILGPVLATIFVGCLETKFKTDLDSRCKTHFRYVDDIFVVCDSASDIIDLQNFLSTMHDNLHFTSEIEENHELPFLDVLVIRPPSRGVATKTKTFRKATWTGQYLHFHSFVPMSYI